MEAALELRVDVWRGGKCEATVIWTKLTSPGSFRSNVWLTCESPIKLPVSGHLQSWVRHEEALHGVKAGADVLPHHLDFLVLALRDLEKREEEDVSAEFHTTSARLSRLLKLDLRAKVATVCFTNLVPQASRPDFIISQQWKKVDFSPQLCDKVWVGGLGTSLVFHTWFKVQYMLVP